MMPVPQHKVLEFTSAGTVKRFCVSCKNMDLPIDAGGPCRECLGLIGTPAQDHNGLLAKPFFEVIDKEEVLGTAGRNYNGGG